MILKENAHTVAAPIQCYTENTMINKDIYAKAVEEHLMTLQTRQLQGLTSLKNGNHSLGVPLRAYPLRRQPWKLAFLM